MDEMELKKKWVTSMLYLVITEFFSQCGEEVTQLSRGDEAIAILVKVSETFNEIISCVARTGFGDGLEIKNNL